MCRTGCATKDCESYSACLRGAGIRVAYANSANGQDYSKQKKWDRELDNYRAAKAEGLQPDGTTQQKVDEAKAVSDLTGQPFKAGLSE